MFYEYLINKMGISPEVAGFVMEAEKDLEARFRKIDEIAAHNQAKVLLACGKNKLSDTHFNTATGYGLHDEGRGVTEAIFADIFEAEAALVRPQLVSGTHALAVSLFGNLRPGDTLLSPVGKPYDTLESVIGIRDSLGSLAEYGVSYRQVDLTDDGEIDFKSVREALREKPKMATIQRSKGYSLRKSFMVAEIRELIGLIREVSPGTIILVDNCYGEFVEIDEPIEADILAGSLMKNPGGGHVLGGGYIVGKEKFVDSAATRLTAPGLGGAVGPTLGFTRNVLQGLFSSPQVVAGAVKGAILAAQVFAKLGFEVSPKPDDERTDIVQAIKLKNEKNMLAFCRGIQKAAPIDSYVTPEPAEMPGYESRVVMAGGTFIQGSTIELSADGPIREPYAVYLQGGLTEAHAKIGVIFALNEMGVCNG